MRKLHCCGDKQIKQGPSFIFHCSSPTYLSSVLTNNKPTQYLNKDCLIVPNLAKMAEQSNPLVSPKSSDSGLHVLLHPLVLLTISDHITRHAARQQQGPIVGALLGQQQGRDISLENAFECNLLTEENGDVVLHHSWFEQRLKECMFCRRI